MNPAQVWCLIKASMIRDGAKEMQGLAPQGDLERRIQEQLDQDKEAS